MARAGLPRLGRPQPSHIDAYLPFILATLEKFPTLTASRLYAMVRERGYAGGPDHFRHVISRHRPRPKAEAYLRLHTLMGEQSQVDWAHFARCPIGRAMRPLMGFVMVLSYSRQIFLRFFLNASLDNFLRGHVGAFETWGGLPRTLLYDNLKSVVLERQGDAIRFHHTLLDFAAHYRFEARPVAIARGNEKGRVERAIRYIRSAFHRPWVEKICPPEAVRMLEGRFSRFDAATLRARLRDCYRSWATTIDPGLLIAGQDDRGQIHAAVCVFRQCSKVRAQGDGNLSARASVGARQHRNDGFCSARRR